MTNQAAPRVTSDVIEGLAKGLAEQAKISLDEAHRVLKVLHVEKLDENVQAFHGIMSDQKAVNALGLSHSAAQESLRVANVSAITVENLRMAIKPKAMRSICV